MKKELVRCWPINGYEKEGIDREGLFITYPGDNIGHDLIICMTCGFVYAVPLDKEIYVGPLRNEQVKSINCINCGDSLENNTEIYPDTYWTDNVFCKFDRRLYVPVDEESILREYFSIYD